MKNKIQEELETAAKDKARPLWQRILAWIGWILAAGLAATYLPSCTTQQQSDAAAIHRLYHGITDSPCVIPSK